MRSRGFLEALMIRSIQKNMFFSFWELQQIRGDKLRSSRRSTSTQSLPQHPRHQKNPIKPLQSDFKRSFRQSFPLFVTTGRLHRRHYRHLPPPFQPPGLGHTTLPPSTRLRHQEESKITDTEGAGAGSRDACAWLHLAVPVLRLQQGLF